MQMSYVCGIEHQCLKYISLLLDTLKDMCMKTVNALLKIQSTHLGVDRKPTLGISVQHNGQADNLCNLIIFQDEERNNHF